MPLIGFCVWMQSGGGDFVAIFSYKSRTTEKYGVNRNIKCWSICGCVAHMTRYKAHMFSFSTPTATASPMNSYILISAESKRQSEEGSDSDQLGGRRLAAEVFAAVCYFRGETNGNWKGKQWLQIWSKSSWSGRGEKRPSFSTFPGEK